MERIPSILRAEWLSDEEYASQLRPHLSVDVSDERVLEIAKNTKAGQANLIASPQLLSALGV